VTYIHSLYIIRLIFKYVLYFSIACFNYSFASFISIGYYYPSASIKKDRIKIGIDRSSVIPVVDWVLKKLTADELAQIEPSFDTAIDAIEDFINDIDFYKISSKYSS
jgi:hypothetical protein